MLFMACGKAILIPKHVKFNKIKKYSSSITPSTKSSLSKFSENKEKRTYNLYHSNIIKKTKRIIVRKNKISIKPWQIFLSLLTSCTAASNVNNNDIHIETHNINIPSIDEVNKENGAYDTILPDFRTNFKSKQYHDYQRQLLSDDIVWNLPNEVLKKAGNEFKVSNNITETSQQPSITALKNGGFIVAWIYTDNSSKDNIFIQVYDANYKKEVKAFKINTGNLNFIENLKVMELVNGGYVVAWAALSDKSSYGIFCQVFDESNNARSNIFQVNTYTNNGQTNPTLAALLDGNFVVSWESFGQDTSLYGIYMQLFNENGDIINNELQVNTYITNNQQAPNACSLNNYNFIIAWENEDIISSYGIKGQMFDSYGSKIGIEFSMSNNTLSNFQINPSLSSLATEEFVMVWQRGKKDNSEYDIYGQRFNNTGSKIESEFQVNTKSVDSHLNPYVCGLGNGGFVVIWQKKGNNLNGNDGIYGQVFDTQGNKTGTEFIIKADIEQSIFYPRVACISFDRFVSIWDLTGQNKTSNGVYGQVFGFFTLSPTKSPSEATQNPSNFPTLNPTSSPSNSPTNSPTNSPANSPTLNPSKAPTESSTDKSLRIYKYDYLKSLTIIILLIVFRL